MQKEVTVDQLTTEQLYQIYGQAIFQFKTMQNQIAMIENEISKRNTNPETVPQIQPDKVITTQP